MAKIIQIPQLTEDEASLHKPLAREFVILYNIYVMVKNNPELFGEENNSEIDSIPLPSWFIDLAFNLNKTANSTATQTAKVIKLSKQPAAEFSSALDQKQPTFELDNIIGSILNKVATANYIEYVARLHDLRCKIVLANYILSDKQTPITNPYGDAQYSIQQSEETICLDGPLPDKHNLRCINI